MVLGHRDTHPSKHYQEDEYALKCEQPERRDVAHIRLAALRIMPGDGRAAVRAGDHAAVADRAVAQHDCVMRDVMAHASANRPVSAGYISVAAQAKKH